MQIEFLKQVRGSLNQRFSEVCRDRLNGGKYERKDAP